MVKCTWMVWYDTLYIVHLVITSSYFDLNVYTLSEDENNNVTIKHEVSAGELYYDDDHRDVIIDTYELKVDVECGATSELCEMARIVVDYILDKLQKIIKEGITIAGECTE